MELIYYQREFYNINTRSSDGDLRSVPNCFWNSKSHITAPLIYTLCFYKVKRAHYWAADHFLSRGCTHFVLWSVAHKQLRPNRKKETNEAQWVSHYSSNHVVWQHIILNINSSTGCHGESPQYAFFLFILQENWYICLL